MPYLKRSEANVRLSWWTQGHVYDRVFSSSEKQCDTSDRAMHLYSETSTTPAVATSSVVGSHLSSRTWRCHKSSNLKAIYQYVIPARYLSAKSFICQIGFFCIEQTLFNNALKRQVRVWSLVYLLIPGFRRTFYRPTRIRFINRDENRIELEPINRTKTRIL